MRDHKRTPVTILTGYLGSGKTTVLNELLKNEAAEKIAIKHTKVIAIKYNCSVNIN